MELRPYQREALEAVRAAYRARQRRVLVVLPTGTGKTVLFAEIARLAKGPVLVLAHRQELVEQAREKVAAWCSPETGIEVAVEMGDRRELTRPRTGGAKITVASVQSLTRRLAQVPRDAFRLVVVDEAHHATAASYRAILEHFDTWALGVTATPDRADRVRLGEVFDAVAYEYDLERAIADGWLAPIRSFLVETRVDFSRVRKVGGELATGEVEAILGRELHLAEMATPILRELGERQGIVFAASVAHAHALTRVLNARAGDPRCAAALDGGASLEARAPVLERFRRREHRLLVNCALFTEGFDVPEIALVAIARPVLSRPFYAQMVGRGTRLFPGKRDLLVLDFAPANARHSLVQAVDIFGRDREEVLAEARRRVAAASREGGSLGIERALELARQEVEARDAEVAYRLRALDPFRAVGIDLSDWLPRGTREAEGERATPEQLAWFRRAGLPADRLRALSARRAHALKEELLDRRAVGLCSPRQAARLVRHGIDPRDLYRDEAAELLRELERR